MFFWYNSMCDSMKKMYIFIGIFLVFICIISIIGSSMISGDNLIASSMDILDVQDNKEVYFEGYGYSISNPNVIVNPYGNSPLTGIVMFDTDGYSEVSITIKGKDSSGDISYTFAKNKHHLIPIYGLYADYDNTVIIRSEGKEKVIGIKTDSLPSDFEYVNDSNSGNFSFYNGSYPYAVDVNNDVRWYLNSNYYGNITLLSGSRIVIGSDRYNSDGTSISIYEMNLLGKIYNEYLLSGSYYGCSALYEDNLLVLSDKVYVLDLQTGEVIYTLFDNDNYDYIGFNDNVIVHNEDGFYEYIDNEFNDISYSYESTEGEMYNNTSNYKIGKGKRYGSLNETKVSNKRISLVGYDNSEMNDIDISIDSDRVTIVNGNDKDIFVIFDKFFDKKIFEIDGSSTMYINKVGFKGKYTIYYSIDDKVYKSNYYIEV